MRIARVLVPIDFSPASDAALEHALGIADACGAEVEVLHVWEPRAPGGGPVFAETEAGLAMEGRLSAAETARPARVSGRLEFGAEPASVILSILRSEPFDLVVLGKRGRGRREDEDAVDELGHVAAAVAGGAPCRAVLLPPPTDDDDSRAA